MRVSQVKLDATVTASQCFASSVLVECMHRDCQSIFLPWNQPFQMLRYWTMQLMRQSTVWLLWCYLFTFLIIFWTLFSPVLTSAAIDFSSSTGARQPVLLISERRKFTSMTLFPQKMYSLWITYEQTLSVNHFVNPLPDCMLSCSSVNF